MLSEAIALAKSNPTDGYKFGSIITDRRGNKISEAHNEYKKSHPLQFKYAKRAGREKAIYPHSELAAILRSRGDGDILYVARINSKGQAAMAKPCPSCMGAIYYETKIKKVIYTIGPEEFGTIEINRR